MDSPQQECITALQNNDEKKFVLVINDTPIKKKNRLVYVRLQKSRLSTFICKKQPSKIGVSEIPVNIDNYWRVLSYQTMYAGVDFKDYLNVQGLKYSVILNSSFNILFIESPIFTLIKDCIKNLKGASINRLSISNVSYEFNEEFKQNWHSIQSQFQIDSIIKYTDLISRVFLQKLNKKMYFNLNRVFKSSLCQDKINFLYLFLKTTGLYNPFLDDKSLNDNLLNTAFAGTKGNRLFIRYGKEYELHCMTVNDFCHSLSLPKKIGFNIETALLMLASLIYAGDKKCLHFPYQDSYGYLIVERDSDTNAVVSLEFEEDYPESNKITSNTAVTEMSALEFFVTRNSIKLGNSVIEITELISLLSEAYLERR